MTDGFEIRIPILPTPGFFSGIKLAVKSLRRLGGAYETVPVVVSVGGDEKAEDTHRINGWSDSDPNVIWRIIPPDRRTPGFSSGFDRFDNPLDREVVVMCDADACLLSDIDPVIDRVGRHPGPAIAAMQAHQSPFGHDPDENARWWSDIFAAFDLAPPDLCLPYTLAPSQNGKAPPYFNFGFVVMNRAAFDIVRRRFKERTLKLAALLQPGNREIFAAQIAMSLIIVESGIAYLPLEPAYNCTNSDEMLFHGLPSEEEIRVLHYQRRQDFDRHTFLCDQSAFDHFAQTRFESQVITHFQSHVLSFPDVFFHPGAKI
ncbi:hypothetical protein [Thalassovita aquimarina]|uniref:Glycosyl transferase family 2 n=1 Tax=Thalassovita aquimarina TaxID=2785917 RepID=A0ABS5HWP0_9RHOB|nr:hypothetical protein [Thalassovita aquimarina]MBR9653345.1 hypothetical protein [Thalassovita aquimarina]